MAAFIALPVAILLVAGSGWLPPFPPDDGTTITSTAPDCANALTIPYDDLFRYNEQYLGRTVRIQGKIDQAVEDTFSKGSYVLRVATKKDQYLGYMGDIVWVEYSGPRCLEGDVIEVCGQVTGLKEYTAVLGNMVTVPEIRAVRLDVLQKSGEVTRAGFSITP